MSRIRSIHPGIYTDEAFVSVGPFARIFLTGLWTECDDYGCFEWKPQRLKMRLLPADDQSAADLLAELVAAGIVMQYTVDGVNYGCVRNFCRYQKPKKPNRFCPINDEVMAFTAEPTSESSVPVPNQSDTSSEIAIQKGGREEGRKGGREEGNPPNPPGEFDKFWAVYPSRAGSNPKQIAAGNFAARIKEGHTAEGLIAAARKYAAYIEATGQTGTEFVMQASSFLGPKMRGFEQDWTPPKKATAEQPATTWRATKPVREW